MGQPDAEGALNTSHAPFARNRRERSPSGDRTMISDGHRPNRTTSVSPEPLAAAIAASVPAKEENDPRITPRGSAIR